MYMAVLTVHRPRLNRWCRNPMIISSGTLEGQGKWQMAGLVVPLANLLATIMPD